ncbi:MAG TPA: DALR anticodon-binding domain-containing protein [Streptosporangiaceae bacterium]
MIPGDIGAELERAIRAGVAAGDLPGQAAGLRATGTWRPAPVRAGGGPGTYATSLPIGLARLAGAEPARLATSLAVGLTRLAWISAARATGSGYLTVTVTTSHLTGLAGRIVAAGPACLNTGALAGSHLTAPRLPDLAAGWDWRSHGDALAGRLAQAAGADVLFLDPERNPHPGPPAPGQPGPVPAAVARYGEDAVRYALARSGAERAIERQLARPMDVSNPYFRVIYAHADAAATLRWAAELGLPARRPDATGQGARPSELVLLDAMSWLPERLAAAARRRRPAELAAHLEHLAGAWLDCRESCPALPFGGLAAPADPAGMAARIERAAAVRTVLGAGLAVLAVTAPARV